MAAGCAGAAGISIHALREEGDRLDGLCIWRQAISIHALREEGDNAPSSAPTTPTHFYPRPPRGGRPVDGCSHAVGSNFYPRPPRGGRPLRRIISSCRIRNFYPRPPRGGRPPLYCSGMEKIIEFLSTPSARRATQRSGCWSRFLRNFYPRPPRGGRHLSVRCHRVPSLISIHALREEGDGAERGRFVQPTNFYPRPPRGGRHVTG